MNLVSFSYTKYNWRKKIIKIEVKLKKNNIQILTYKQTITAPKL